jgi:hypothetical protein
VIQSGTDIHIRHAQVTVDFSIPSSEWVISAVGIENTRDLALTNRGMRSVAFITAKSQRQWQQPVSSASNVSVIGLDTLDRRGWFFLKCFLNVYENLYKRT